MNHSEDTEDYPVHDNRSHFPMELGRSLAEMWQLVKKQHRAELETANLENRKLRAENKLLFSVIRSKASPSDLMKLPPDVRSYALTRGSMYMENDALQDCLCKIRDDVQLIFNLTHVIDADYTHLCSESRKRVTQLAYAILHMNPFPKVQALFDTDESSDIAAGTVTTNEPAKRQSLWAYRHCGRIVKLYYLMNKSSSRHVGCECTECGMHGPAASNEQGALDLWNAMCEKIKIAELVKKLFDRGYILTSGSPRYGVVKIHNIEELKLYE